MKHVLLTGLAFGLIAACSQTEFKGNSTKVAAAKTDDATPAPAETPNESSTPVAETPAVKSPDPIPNGELFVGCKTGSTSLPIVADVYKLPEGTNRLPDFASIGPKSDTVCLTNYNIPNQSWTAGFPGSSQLVEWFALTTKAKINIATAGEYVFRITSDDGANLYIDSKKIVDNDGNHASKTTDGAVQLSKGAHKLILDWYQGPRFDLGLELYWKVPGSSEFVIVPTSAFSPE